MVVKTDGDCLPGGSRDLRFIGILRRSRRFSSGEVFQPTHLACKPLFTLKYRTQRQTRLEKLQSSL